jgi:pimeloyl-ACP methyl ester carboxylesterase
MERSDQLERGRNAYARQAWADAFAQLTAADTESPLDPADLERLATAAYLVGKDTDSTDLWSRAHHERLGRGDAEGAARCAIKAGSKQISDAELQGIDVPVVLIWGSRDRMVPLRIAELAGSKFGWPLHIVDDVGHVPHIEQPEAFLRVLQEALQEP